MEAVHCDGKGDHKVVRIDLFEEISVWDIAEQVQALVISVSLEAAERFHSLQTGNLRAHSTISRC